MTQIDNRLVWVWMITGWGGVKDAYPISNHVGIFNPCPHLVLRYKECGVKVYFLFLFL